MALQPHIIKLIQAHTQGVFSLACCGLYDGEIEEAVKLINLNPKITSLDLDDNNFGDGAVTSLLALLHVTQLTVANNNIKNDGAMRLIRNKQFRGLDLSKNYLNNEITPLILKEATQTYLKISYTKIPPNSIMQIEEKISLNLKHHQDEFQAKILNLKEEKSTSSATGLFSKSTDKSDSNESDTNRPTPPSSSTSFTGEGQ